jgi:hypothetical protein
VNTKFPHIPTSFEGGNTEEVNKALERFVSLKVLDHVVYPHKHTKAEWGDEDRIPKWKHRNYKEKNYLS